ncbi:MAG: tetratricopeptide repeat protein [Alistipes sp.]|nr:tetratricopeptide repeat protein [Alistipes sp.]
MISLILITPLFVQAQQTKKAEKGDTPNKPQLIIPDSLRATYKYTDALKALTIYNDTTTALPLLHEAIEIDSTYAPAHYELGSFYSQSNLRRATRHARKAYEQDTTSRWYMALYGQMLAMSADYDAALPLFQKLIKQDKENPDHYRILALLYQQRQQPYSAISVLDSAEMRFGKISQLVNLKRHLLIRTNQMDRAIEEAQQAVDAAPYEVENVILLGHTYASAGRDSLARVTLRQAIQMDSTSIDALTTYVDFCSQRRDMNDYLATLKLLFAQPHYPLDIKVDIAKKLTADRPLYSKYYYPIGSMLQTLLIHNPDQKSVIDLYGDHLLAMGELDAALEHFKHYLDSEPPQMDYYMAVIDLEDYLQHPDSVDFYVQRAMERFPDDPKLLIRKANRQYIKGNLMGAVDTFHEAIALADNDTLRGELWGYVGDTYHSIAERKEQMKKAKIKRDTTGYKLNISLKKAKQKWEEAYEKSLSLYADNAMSLNNYAYFLCEDNRLYEKAIAMSTRAITLESNNATYLDTHAWALYKLGRFEEARNVMRKALMLDTTGSAALMMHYGDILCALGEYFMAKTYWEKALAAGADPDMVATRLEELKTLENK